MAHVGQKFTFSLVCHISFFFGESKFFFYLFTFSDIYGKLKSYITAIRPLYYTINDNKILFEVRVMIFPFIRYWFLFHDDLIGAKFTRGVNSMKFFVTDSTDEFFMKNILHGLVHI